MIRFISHPFVLGFCCLALALVNLVQRDQINEQSAAQRCRDRIDATLLAEMARSVQRIEATYRFDAEGDEWGAVDAVSLTDAETDAYELAISRRERAVSICGGG